MLRAYKTIINDRIKELQIKQATFTLTYLTLHANTEHGLFLLLRSETSSFLKKKKFGNKKKITQSASTANNYKVFIMGNHQFIEIIDTDWKLIKTCVLFFNITAWQYISLIVMCNACGIIHHWWSIFWSGLYCCLNRKLCKENIIWLLYFFKLRNKRMALLILSNNLCLYQCITSKTTPT